MVVFRVDLASKYVVLSQGIPVLGVKSIKVSDLRSGCFAAKSTLNAVIDISDELPPMYPGSSPSFCKRGGFRCPNKR